MSKRGVSIVIHTLLTDHNMRDRFAESPMDVLAVSRPHSLMVINSH